MKKTIKEYLEDNNIYGELENGICVKCGSSVCRVFWDGGGNSVLCNSCYSQLQQEYSNLEKE